MATADLPIHDRTDFDDAGRGFLGSLDPCVVTDATGRVVWDNDAYAFLDGACPDTAHPSLWRQGQLVVQQGLYEVCDGIYQVRGLDLSNMTLVEGDIMRALDGSYSFANGPDDTTDITYHLTVELVVPIPGFVRRRAEGKIMGTALRELKLRAESLTV